jgi:TetR/AcrR family transcriptional regulator, transcriptional repressor for nem operon
MEIIMRYAKDHKEATRRRIIESASRTFRRDGIVASGVVGLMSEAGLTQGGFYTHFASKDVLVDEALHDAMTGTRRWFAQAAADARAAGKSPIGSLIDRYLSEKHLDMVDSGCAFSALGPELSRQSDASRRTAQRGLADLVDVLATELPPERREYAAPLFALLSGTLQFARLAGTRADAVALLEGGRRAAHELTGAY